MIKNSKFNHVLTYEGTVEDLLKSFNTTMSKNIFHVIEILVPKCWIDFQYQAIILNDLRICWWKT